MNARGDEITSFLPTVSTGSTLQLDTDTIANMYTTIFFILFFVLDTL